MDERIELLSRRARRLRARGEFRKAANAYGELTSVEPQSSRWWVLLATMLHEAHRNAEAAKAFRQAAFLFRRTGDSARGRSLAHLVAAMPDLAAAA